MSFAYGLATSIRRDGASDLPKFLDLFAALVPGEVLAAHGVILTVTTGDPGGTGGTQIIAVGVLRFAFWALVLASAFLYAAGRGGQRNWVPIDWIRVLVPPSAFVGWTMLQKPSAFDAVCSGLGWPARISVAVVLALFLGAAVDWLRDKSGPQDRGREEEVDVVVLQG